MPDGAHKLQGWFAELRRRKVFRVAVVYAVAAWLLIQVADAVFEPLGLPAWTLKLVIVLALLGFPLACALAWAFDVTPRGIERTPPAPGAAAESTVAVARLPPARRPRPSSRLLKPRRRRPPSPRPPSPSRYCRSRT